MEDNKLKDLFAKFEPDLSSSTSFMSKLQNNLDQVEIVRQHNAHISANRKKAIVIAACIGFIVGILFSSALPYINTIIMNLQPTVPSYSLLKPLTDNYLKVLTWGLIAGTTALISLNAYNLSFSILKRKTDITNKTM